MTNEELRVWAIEVAVEAGVRGSSALVDAADEIVAFVRPKMPDQRTRSPQFVPDHAVVA